MTLSLEENDPEIIAISTVIGALKDLPSDARSRVLDYAERKLNGDSALSSVSTRSPNEFEHVPQSAMPPIDKEEADGINDIARKWILRNGLTAHGLGTLFSLGVNDIELVAKKVPGLSRKERMRSVVLLRGVASYLGSGVARFTHVELKETCMHYDAYDVKKSAAYLKQFATEVVGSAKGGYSLSARGLASAADLVKSLIAPSN